MEVLLDRNKLSRAMVSYTENGVKDVEQVKGYFLTPDVFLAFPSEGKEKLQRYFVPKTMEEVEQCIENDIPYVNVVTCERCRYFDRTFDGNTKKIQEYVKYNDIEGQGLLNKLLQISGSDKLVEATYVSGSDMAMDDDSYIRTSIIDLAKRSGKTVYCDREPISESLSIFKEIDGKSAIIPIVKDDRTSYCVDSTYYLEQFTNDIYISKITPIDWRNLNDSEINDILYIYENYRNRENGKQKVR